MRKQFKEWLKEICRWDRDDWFVQWRYEEHSADRWKASCLIYTHNYKYCITAVDHKGDRAYLGCTVSCRKPRAGEDWTRGNDLPDGEFSRKTWEKIKDSIIQYELVKIAKPIRREGVPEEGPSIE